MLKTTLSIVLIIIGVCYPAIVYFGLAYFELNTVLLALLGVLVLRIMLTRKKVTIAPWFIPASLLGGMCLVGAIVWQSTLIASLYPVIISSVMLVSFSYSLWRGPSVIETFARLQEPELDERGVRYTRKVTQVWCGFFVINIGIASWTVFSQDLALWALYNGFISYCLMGVLLGGEFIFRQWYKQRAQS